MSADRGFAPIAIDNGSENALRAAAEVLADYREHVVIASALGPGQPDTLLRALISTALERRLALTLLFADVPGRLAFLDEPAEARLRSGHLRLVSLAGSIPARLSGAVDYMSNSLWELDRLFDSGALQVDVFAARVVRTDSSETVSFGDMVGYTPTLLDRARDVAFEATPSGRTFAGEHTTVAVARADVCFAAPQASVAHEPRAASALPPMSATRSAMAGRAAALIPDGATLQIGLGAAPESVIEHLSGKRDLGLHSGMLPGAIRALMDCHTVTGSRKAFDRGAHVATGVLDDEREGAGQWCAEVRLEPIALTHSPRVLAEHRCFWAVNSAFEIDLGGQINAEYVAGARVASAGGQSDFTRAAHMSDGGGSILVLPSRTSGGRPRVVDRLSQPRVTSTGADLDFVVTEHGVAELRGASADQRAQRLIEVAHPDDRPALRRARVIPT